jgi:anti-sigma factor RsiW
LAHDLVCAGSLNCKLLSNQAIVQYLLGELSETDASALEHEYFTDPQFFDQVVDAENDLVDKHARGQLSPPMQERFETYFLAHHWSALSSSW